MRIYNRRFQISSGISIILLHRIALSSVLAFPGHHDCTEPCLSQMQMELQGMDDASANGGSGGGRSGNAGALPWSQFLHSSQSAEVMEKFFNKICLSYDNVDNCLAECEARSRTGVNIRQTYAGLKFICKDMKHDFFSALPCLAEYEPVAMIKCKPEINQSHLTTAQFTESIVNRELHSIRSRFRTLCQDLANMITCMEPVIREGCGNGPTNMMLNFIRLEFGSFEQLYSQLGFVEPLPSSCRSLLALPTPQELDLPREVLYQEHAFSRAVHLAPFWDVQLAVMVAVLWRFVRFP